jgi:hypothetical protein
VFIGERKSRCQIRLTRRCMCLRKYECRSFTNASQQCTRTHNSNYITAWTCVLCVGRGSVCPTWSHTLLGFALCPVSPLLLPSHVGGWAQSTVTQAARQRCNNRLVPPTDLLRMRLFSSLVAGQFYFYPANGINLSWCAQVHMLKLDEQA